MIDVPGCTDQYSENYNAAANVDDGSCTCSGNVLVMNMFDSASDGWNGDGYTIVDAATSQEMLSGKLASG